MFVITTIWVALALPSMSSYDNASSEWGSIREETLKDHPIPFWVLKKLIQLSVAFLNTSNENQF